MRKVVAATQNQIAGRVCFMFSSRHRPIVETFKGYWTRELVQHTPNKLFVFGDNEEQRGRSGQAVIRGLANAHGIPTKKRPSLALDAFWSDKDYEANVTQLCTAFLALHKRAQHYDAVVFSEAGLGTGLAQLHVKAPRTYAFLQAAVAHFKSCSTAEDG